MDPGGEDEVLEIGRRSARAPRRGWLLLGVAVVAVAVLVVTGVTGAETPDRAAPDRQPSPQAQSTPVGPPVEVRHVGRHLLGVHAGWEVIAYARATGRLYRAELSSGRVARTVVPPLQSSGPLTVLVLEDRTLIRPLDHVPGYVVVDGQRARRERLSGGGVVLPGPQEGTLWIQSRANDRKLVLVTADGQPTGREIVLPRPTGWPVPDGRGHALVMTVDGWYVVDGRTDVHRVTTGTVLAAGPSAFLLLECADPDACVHVVLDRVDGTRRRLGPVDRPLDSSGVPGVVAPDGSVAAMEVPGVDDRSLRLVDLRTGEVTDVDLPSGTAPGGSALAWAPDGSWLLVAADKVLTVRPRAGADPVVEVLGLELTGITSVAVRPGAAPDTGPPRTWRSGGDARGSGNVRAPDPVGIGGAATG